MDKEPFSLSEEELKDEWLEYLFSQPGPMKGKHLKELKIQRKEQEALRPEVVGNE